MKNSLRTNIVRQTAIKRVANNLYSEIMADLSDILLIVGELKGDVKALRDDFKNMRKIVAQHQQTRWKIIGGYTALSFVFGLIMNLPPFITNLFSNHSP